MARNSSSTPFLTRAQVRRLEDFVLANKDALLASPLSYPEMAASVSASLAFTVNPYRLISTLKAMNIVMPRRPHTGKNISSQFRRRRRPNSNPTPASAAAHLPQSGAPKNITLLVAIVDLYRRLGEPLPETLTPYLHFVPTAPVKPSDYRPSQDLSPIPSFNSNPIPSPIPLVSSPATALLSPR